MAEQYLFDGFEDEPEEKPFDICKRKHGGDPRSDHVYDEHVSKSQRAAMKLCMEIVAKLCEAQDYVIVDDVRDEAESRMKTETDPKRWKLWKSLAHIATCSGRMSDCKYAGLTKMIGKVEGRKGKLVEAFVIAPEGHVAPRKAVTPRPKRPPRPNRVLSGLDLAVCETVRAAGPTGRTIYEVGEGNPNESWKHPTVSAAMNRLAYDGFIVKTRRGRKNVRRNGCAIWIHRDFVERTATDGVDKDPNGTGE